MSWSDGRRSGRPAPGRAPVLILTTGTTGEPKGARHDWRGSCAVRCDARSRAGAPVAARLQPQPVRRHPDPASRARQRCDTGRAELAPRRRRDRDDPRARVTHASATPTFWRLVVGRLDARMRSALALEQITLGGEAASEQPDRRSCASCSRTPASRTCMRARSSDPRCRCATAAPGCRCPCSTATTDADVRFRIVDGELQIARVSACSATTARR